MRNALYLPVLLIAAMGCGGNESATPADETVAESRPSAAAAEECHWTMDITGDMTLNEDGGERGYPGPIQFYDEGEDGSRDLSMYNLTMATTVGYLIELSVDDTPAKGTTGTVPIRSAGFQRWGSKDMEGPRYTAYPEQGKGSGTMNITENSDEWFAADINATLLADDSGEEIQIVASMRERLEGRCGE